MPSNPVKINVRLRVKPVEVWTRSPYKPKPPEKGGWLKIAFLVGGILFGIWLIGLVVINATIGKHSKIDVVSVWSTADPLNKASQTTVTRNISYSTYSLTTQRSNCNEEGKVFSSNSGNSETINLENQTNEPLQVHWLNQTGDRIYITSLNSGESKHFSGEDSFFYLISSKDGSCYGIFKFYDNDLSILTF